MNQFYLKSGDEMVAGPFTGIEVREAALANLVFPDTGVAATADGPWTPAADVGLLSDEIEPQSHLGQTEVPKFRMKDASEALGGPFKLRELIELASRQILPSDASIQLIGRDDWIPVNQFGILVACLQGKLPRNPTSGNSSKVDPLLWDTNSASNHDAPPVTANDLLTDPQDDLDTILTQHRKLVRKDVRKRIAKKGNSKFKIAYVGGLVTSLLVCAIVWWLQSPSWGTNRNEVLGDWALIASHKESKSFGISFKEDGTCVVFNSDGNCWSGDFEWSDDATDEFDFQSLGDPTKSKVNEITSSHHRGEVSSSDGYVRFKGATDGKTPMLGDKPIRECFLRRHEDVLWMGYLGNVDNQSLNAGWVQLWPRDREQGFGPVRSDWQGTRLIARYGVPDEARRLNPNEITANRDPKSAEPRSLVRYGTQRLALFADGTARPFKDPATSNSSDKTKL